MSGPEHERGAAPARRDRAVLEALPVPLARVAADGRIVAVNPAFTRSLGWEAAELPDLETWFRAAFPVEEERRRALAAWKGASEPGSPGSPVGPQALAVRRKDGKQRRMLLSAVPLDGERLLHLVDVTALHEMEAQLALSARLAAMATLVGGVAHEINNPLAAVLSDQGVALEVVDDVRAEILGGGPLVRQAVAQRLDGVIEALREAQEGGQRIARVVKEMVRFASPRARRERVALAALVRDALRWIPSSVGHRASLQLEDAGAPPVLAAPGQVQQIVVNLVTNAAHATPRGERGTIVIRVGPGAPGMARLEVVDRGVGIPSGDLERIFEPFYTTRVTGEERGIGMGLAVCRSLAAAHGGTVTVESEPGKGSTFRVEFPEAPPP